VTVRARSVSLRRRRISTPPGPDPTIGPVRVLAPSLGTIAVTELFEILVDHHGLATRHAVGALVIGLELAGYPGNATTVAAADGLDIVQNILEDLPG
jgi:hypothetical protein